VHRTQLAARLDSANKFYLKLFERMLSEVLAMHRVKFRNQTAAMEELRQMMEAVQALLDKEREKVEGLRAQVERLEGELVKVYMCVQQPLVSWQNP
jgi:hypothetical protein